MKTGAKYTRWYLHEDVTNVEAADQRIELCALHTKVFLETTEPCSTAERDDQLEWYLYSLQNVVRSVTSVHLVIAGGDI